MTLEFEFWEVCKTKQQQQRKGHSLVSHSAEVTEISDTKRKGHIVSLKMSKTSWLF